MIIWRKQTPPYSVLVHGPDITMDCDPFATLRKDGEFIHHTQWTAEERALVADTLAEAQDPGNRQTWNNAHNIFTKG